MSPFENPQKNKEKVIKCFNDLAEFLVKLDPVKLITQLTLTYLFYPGGEFKPEHDDIHKWSRWIEFLSGFLLTRQYPENGKKLIDGRTLSKLEKLLEQYFKAINHYLISEISGNRKPNGQQLIFHLKIYSLNVRGDTFPHKLLELSHSLYSTHPTLFQNKYGFSIDDAIHLYKSIINELENRINKIRTIYRQRAKIETDEQIIKNPELKENRHNIELSNFVKLLFLNSDSHLSFTLHELTAFSNLSPDICSAFLSRLSQTFGYRNRHYPKTYTDSLKAPWDYNTLYERPIVMVDSKYFIPNSALFPTVLLNTFHYDLITDENYKDEYNSIRGKWLEKRIAETLTPIFGSDNVILNPEYPNGEELSDVLVLYDRKIFIIQCKSKALRYESKIGEDYEILKSDIKKGIRESFDQALKARRYLLETEHPNIISNNIRLTVDTDQVTDVFLVSITLGYYQSIVTRLANFDTELYLFQENDFPWAVSLADFETIAEIVNDPSEFIHYTKQRIKIERTNFHLSADEIDLLNYYLSQGLNFKSGDFEEYSGVMLTGFSSQIEEYFHNKYLLGKKVDKPNRDLSEGFREYLDEIGLFNTTYKSDCIDRLLLLNKESQKAFIDKVDETRKGILKEKKIRAMNMVFSVYDFGVTFLLMDSKLDINNLYQQIFSYSILRKYEQKLTTWVGLGVDVNSPKKVDMAVYISYPWIKDAEIEKMIELSKSNI
jgi:hypothetical protein